jgi:hypothetical protein
VETKNEGTSIGSITFLIGSQIYMEIEIRGGGSVTVKLNTNLLLALAKSKLKRAHPPVNGHFVRVLEYQFVFSLSFSFFLSFYLSTLVE